MTSKRWRIRLTARAEADFLQILDWSAEQFGPRQADMYEGHLLTALTTLEAGPDILGSIARPDIRADLRTYHIARCGVVARHLICYRPAEDQEIEVLRILHDAMDFTRHVPKA